MREAARFHDWSVARRGHAIGWAQAPAKQHRTAVIIPAGPVAIIRDTGGRYSPAFFAELRRLGDIEGQNLSVERYSAEGRPEGLADLARDVVNRNPDLIVATTNPIALAARAAAGTIPIVWIGSEPIRAGLATSLARPGGDITGVAADPAYEIFGKQLQLLKEAVPSASKVAYLTITTVYGQRFRQLLREISQRLEISLIDLVVQEATPPKYERVFVEIAREPVDAIIVSGIGDPLALPSADSRFGREKPPAGNVSVPRLRTAGRADGLCQRLRRTRAAHGR